MRYLIGLIITIGVILFVIIRLLVGGGTPAPTVRAADLTKLATSDSVVRFTVQTPIQASQNHYEIQITVGRNLTDFVLYKGYDQAVVRTKTYPMTETAYADFLHGLEISGNYTKGNTDAALKDERGYCALGDRYIYEIIDEAGDVAQHYWSTSCGQKTFHGDADVVQQLFQRQVPDYETLTKDIDY
jgi:hypothetical protein